MLGIEFQVGTFLQHFEDSFECLLVPVVFLENSVINLDAVVTSFSFSLAAFETFSSVWILSTFNLMFVGVGLFSPASDSQDFSNRCLLFYSSLAVSPQTLLVPHSLSVSMPFTLSSIFSIPLSLHA